MSAITHYPSRHSSSWHVSSAIAQAYRFFRMALRHRAIEDELGGLSDRYLRDVGVDRRQISEAVSAEITRASLLDAGWTRSRSCGPR